MNTRVLRRLFVFGLVLAIVLPSVPPISTSAASSLHYLYGSGSQTGGRRITLRVELTEPAAQGGVDVALTASNPAIQMPASVHVGTGQQTKEFTVTTSPVTSDANITVSAKYAGVIKSRVVLIKAARLKAVTVQSVIRHGGTGRIMIALTGPAPTGGFSVGGDSTPAGILAFPLGNYIVPAGADRLVLSVAANLMGLSSSSDRLPSQFVEVRVDDGAKTLTAETTVKDFGNDPRPTATASNTPTDTPAFTATNTATPTATPTNTPIPLSDGCQFISIETGSVGASSFIGFPFNAGDVITLDFAPIMGSTATSIEIHIVQSISATDITTSVGIPGHYSWTVPVTGDVETVYWTTVPYSGVNSSRTCSAGPIPTSTPLPTEETATDTPVPTGTNTPTQTAIATLTNTATPTATHTPSQTATATMTDVPTQTATAAPANSETPTPTNTPVPEPTSGGGGGGGGGCLKVC